MLALFGCASMMLLAGGCETFRTLTAPQDEYSAYRKVRTARSIEERLKASDAYLEQHPEGRWSGEVRPWFQRAEAKYFSHRDENPVGLAEYLAVLPHGPHASTARLELLRHRARVAEGAQARLAIDARYTEQRLAELARQRESARETLGAWVGRLLAIRTWGQRTSALDDEFIFAWRIDKPQARCEEDRCFKLVELPFDLPGGGDDAKREMDFEVVLTLEQGGVQQAALQGPGMFSRLYEAARAKPVIAGDNQARVLAIAFAVEFLNGAAEAHLPAARCAGEVVGTTVFKRACEGLSIEAIAAEDPAIDDKIVVRGQAQQ
jgi:hypothetical protein